MFFSWWRRRRRKRILARPFPEQWDRILDENVALVRTLLPAERETLHRNTMLVVAEKNWEGCNGLVMSDEIKVTIAGTACLLTLGFDDEYFDSLLSVLVYPDSYVAKQTTQAPGGVVEEGFSSRLGEAWYGGPIILSWQTVLENGRHPGNGNVVLHEFAHYLDMQSRSVDGTPRLTTREQYARWKEVMTAEYNQLIRDAYQGRPTLLDQYGATNAAEFFAVATECFLERPVQMKTQQVRLYQLLAEFYQQDPAGRNAG